MEFINVRWICFYSIWDCSVVVDLGLAIGGLVEESADSAVESVDSTSNSTADPVKIGLWVE